MQILVRQSFCFEQEAQAVDRVLEIRLRRCVTALLQFVEIIFDLLRVEFRRKTLEVKSDRCHMTAIVVESAGTSAKNGNVALKALE